MVDDQHRVGGHLPVQGLGLHLGDVDIDTAHGVDDLDKGVEVDPDKVVHFNVVALLHRFHRQLGAAVAEGVLILIAVQQDRHAGAALDRHKADDMILDVHRHEDHTVSTGIITELGRILRAVELVQVGKGIGVIDGLGALVRADEQDIQHILRENGVNP